MVVHVGIWILRKKKGGHFHLDVNLSIAGFGPHLEGLFQGVQDRVKCKGIALSRHQTSNAWDFLRGKKSEFDGIVGFRNPADFFETS